MSHNSPVSVTLIGVLAAACLTLCSGAPSKADRVVQWAKDSGATVHLKVTQVHPSGLRGTIAEKNFEEGEVIVDIPYNLTVELASAPAANTSMSLPPSKLFLSTVVAP
eukprot:jgi/Botrbrau1/19751/Bobra.0124s0004.1